MEKKDKVGLKTTVALMLLLLFFFVQGAIVVITKIKGVQSAIVRGTVIWSFVVMHFAQDGMSPLFHNTVDMWNDEQFDTWLAYHLSVCAEKTIIDMSNHVVIIGKKN